VVAFGVEGTGSYGIGLTRFLRRGGHTVFEVYRPPRKAERRLQGKGDTVDAEHAARQVLAGTATAVPKLGDGDIESLRLVKLARDTAVAGTRRTHVPSPRSTQLAEGDAAAEPSRLRPGPTREDDVHVVAHVASNLSRDCPAAWWPHSSTGTHRRLG
jgi:transposase